MTLSPDGTYLVEKNSPRATDSLLGGLFLQKERYKEETDEKYDLTSKIYLLMKRLHQNYQQILMMSIEEREKFFNLELELIKEENKQKEKE